MTRRSWVVPVGRAAIAGGVVLWTARRARRGDVGPVESAVFRAVNDAPDALHPLFWPVMQAGSLGAVYATAVAARWRSGARQATLVATVGTLVWGGVKLVKPAVGRGRPDAHLTGVHVRGADQSGLGYPSGHAAVSLSLALLVARPVGGRSGAVVVSVLTGVARMYVGAHLPLDVMGGWGIGALVAEATRVTRKLP